MQEKTKRVMSGVWQVVFFLVLIWASLLAAGLISNKPPWTDPPGVALRLWIYLTSNVAETTPDSVFPELRPQPYAGPAALIFDVARRAAEALKWELTTVDPEARKIEAVVTSTLFGFKDDATLWVVADVEGDTDTRSTLYARSASRVGQGDLAANTRHIMNLFATANTIAPASTIIVERERDAPDESPPHQTAPTPSDPPAAASEVGE